MTKKASPLVSVIITTKNSHPYIFECLNSIKKQNYNNIETIVVDNNSSDDTKKIARKFTTKVYDKGPERSAQRNFGAKKSRGKYLLFIDSDMVLSKNVVKDCVEMYKSGKGKIAGIIIPEVSIGKSFWAKCKALERSFYYGVDWMEAARFFEKETFLKTNGYDEDLISGEDWDLSQAQYCYEVSSNSFFN